MYDPNAKIDLYTRTEHIPAELADGKPEEVAAAIQQVWDAWLGFTLMMFSFGATARQLCTASEEGFEVAEEYATKSRTGAETRSTGAGSL